MTGTIKTLTQKGFGFIAREDGQKDIFFHSKELQGVMYDELRLAMLSHLKWWIPKGTQRYECFTRLRYYKIKSPSLGWVILF